ncbi:Stk1 family PASTA domain-containing Ser/Thr kinase [Jatrophihabitans telluris]|uniref:non-specific serine/threonine protein kinase n=1 Tax=Jatrophihabitans telluris TaxID=2038343 RepID=A0ABY4QZV0_9ACTN|nr:Stk1 family PASTA domain-containing Ser/Thr kinase [Jatrophihabitans telluris]UQX88632.1 Stk1 family PASTA domain-containing Ser/Thr kinase [Jatrophihabitans telluris]
MTAPHLVGGRYELGELIGYGGMAEVHRGRDIRLGREVAVKVLRSDLARDPSFQNRFRREAQAAAGLNHPSIVAVYDTGEDGDPAGLDDTPSPYIVMEFVQGRTLREVLKSEGQLPARRAMEIVAEVCGALDFSHRSGIVHRDIKPGNVMITNSGAVKVMDFGIARALADNAATVTATSAVIGTAQYLSPEQARGESVDARSDVYSTGCLLYELLTGHPPFTGDSPVAVAYQHVRENPRIPSSENPAVTKALDSIVMKALAKNPLNRYQTAGEMRADLQRAIAGQPVEAESVMTDEERTQFISRPSAAALATPRPGVLTPVYDDEDDHRGRRGAIMWVAVVLALLLVIGGTAFLLLRKDNPKTPTLVAVPRLIGLSQAAANNAIRAAGLAPDSATPEQSNGPCTSTASTPVTKDHVCTQDPPAGKQVDQGGVVSFTIYAGPAPVQVPAVSQVNLTCAQASAELAKVKLVSQCKSVHSAAPAGTVIDQDPNGLASVQPGTTVVLQVADGKAKLPNVLHLPYDEARIKLNNAGWTTVVMTLADRKTGFKVGQVQAMYPGQGTYLDPKTKITLEVAKQPLPACSTSTSTSPSASGSTSSSPGSTPSSSPSATPSVTPSSTPTDPNASPTCTTPAG